MRILIATPMKREARAIGGQTRVVGVGGAARSRLVELLRDTQPEVVLVAGICGALDPSLPAGDVIVSRSVVEAGSPELTADTRCVEAAHQALAVAAQAAERRRSPTVVAGRLLTVAVPDTKPEERRQLWNTVSAIGIDMETYALAETATAHGVRWLALRAVSDSARMRLPGPIESWRSEDDDGRVARAIACRPWTWAPTIRLALDVRVALSSLARSVEIVSEALEPL